MTEQPTPYDCNDFISSRAGFTSTPTHFTATVTEEDGWDIQCAKADSGWVYETLAECTNWNDLVYEVVGSSYNEDLLYELTIEGTLTPTRSYIWDYACYEYDTSIEFDETSWRVIK